MFTGLIEEIGTLDCLQVQGDFGQITLLATKIQEGTKLGDSIAVNGVCLTVTNLKKDRFTADVMPETLKRSNLGRLQQGTSVNLERAIGANGRFGGHMVAGHIDGMGRLTARKQEGNAIRLTISTDVSLLLQMVAKGSIAVDGVSLTLLCVEKSSFCVGIIPHTGGETILLQKKIGDTVNLETDMIGKYIQRFMEKETESTPSLTLGFLASHGY